MACTGTLLATLTCLLQQEQYWKFHIPRGIWGCSCNR